MDVFLEAATNPLWMVGVFVALLVVFHLLLVFIFPLSAKHWKLVDYIWVTLTFISSLGFVDEARRYKAEVQLESSWVRTDSSLRAVESWFENYQVFACEDAADDPEYTALCQWITVKQRDLEIILSDEDKPVALPAAFIDDVSATELIPEQERNIAVRILNDYDQNRTQYLQSVQDAESSPLRKLFVVFAPILFAAALALKMTKVTGEYRTA